ncbi:MAG: hypothetical protein PHU29_09920 [Sulfuricurvum sp.]|nr:hypothetical protein [Sulfuricurvum sp.]
MKRLFLFLFFPYILWGYSINTQITFTGEPMVSLRTITQAFNILGYKFDISALSVQNGYGNIEGIASGNRVFTPEVLGENLKEQGIQIDSAHADQNGLILVLNTQSAIWNTTLLGSDEGSELKRVNSAQWFRVEQGQNIRIVAPYTSKWYPEIAVLDISMHVLDSFRSLEPKDEYQFELPQNAYYLKISNAQGMKVIREGMWIESMSQGR